MLIFAKNLAEAMQIIASQPISLALVDLGLPDGNGITLIEKLRGIDESALILVISAWSTQQSLFASIKAGANGYVLKERDDAEVLMSIRSILRGGAPIDPFIAREILNQISTSNTPQTERVEQLDGQDYDQLTNRETEILNLVAQGLRTAKLLSNYLFRAIPLKAILSIFTASFLFQKRTKAVSTARSLGIL